MSISSRQLATGFALFTVFAIFVLAFAVPPAYLTPLLFILTALAWLSVWLFAGPTLARPRIGALTERAWIGVVIAAMGTVFCILVLNSDAAHRFIDVELVQRLSRLTILAVLLVPAIWIFLYITGRLGQGDE